MSAYNTRYCPKHGDWDQDVDDPYEECGECLAEGLAPSQLEAKEKERMQQQIEDLRQSIEAKDSMVFSLLKQRKDALLRGDKWKRRAEDASELLELQGSVLRYGDAANLKQKVIETLHSMLDRHMCMGESVEKIKIEKLEKEIETLRDDNQELENDLDDARNNLSWEKKEIETLRKWQTDMVAKLAEEHDLAGYRELGEKLAARDEEIEDLRSMVDKDSKSLRNRAIEIADLVTERDECKRRAELIKAKADLHELVGGLTFWTSLCLHHPELNDLFEE